jgi:hypothetical protein
VGTVGRHDIDLRQLATPPKWRSSQRQCGPAGSRLARLLSLRLHDSPEK